MTQQTHQVSTSMVFTLQEDDVSKNELHETDWERSLNELRSRSDHNEDILFTENIVIAPRENKRQTTENTQNPNEANITTHFGDSELDAAYREYLRRCEAEHNAQLKNTVQTDVDVLIQEDWLAAQTALQSERNRRHLVEKQTIVLKNNHDAMDEELILTPTEITLPENTTKLPEFAIHVYEIPNAHTKRKLRVVSEKELMQGIVDKLKPHLSNAVAGMVRQALQKKLATISYDLQISLNDETPKIVQEVLEHNLDIVFRTVKNSLRD